MQLKAKCPYCGKEFIRKEEDEGVVWVKNTIEGLGTRSYYHVDCYKLAKTTPKKEWPAWVKKLKNAEDELNLYTEMCYDYLRRDLKIAADFVKIKSQLKNFNKSRSMRYEGMYKTLLYCYEVQHMDKTKAEGGVGIIPYQYESAYNYFVARKGMANDLNDLIEEQIKAKKNAVMVQRSKNVVKKKDRFSLVEADEME